MSYTQKNLEEIKKVRRGMRIKILVNSHLQEWDIVDSSQGDTVRKIISCDAPLIQLIWDMEEGQSITGQFGTKELFVEIKNISLTPKKERMY